MSKILLLGATGLVGGLVLQRAGSRPISILVRNSIAGLPKSVKVHIANGDDFPKRIASIKPDVVVCAIGTTWKKANANGGTVQFRAVDEYLVLACAHYAAKAGTKQMLFVSSAGANHRVDNLYLGCKGRVEQGLRAMGFDRVDIFRPGLLRGDRQEFRLGEAFARMIAPALDLLLIGGMRKFRSISAGHVAQAIWACVGEKNNGVFVHDFDGIQSLAS